MVLVEEMKEIVDTLLVLEVLVAQVGLVALVEPEVLAGSAFPAYPGTPGSSTRSWSREMVPCMSEVSSWQSEIPRQTMSQSGTGARGRRSGVESAVW